MSGLDEAADIDDSEMTDPSSTPRATAKVRIASSIRGYGSGDAVSCQPVPDDRRERSAESAFSAV